MITQHWGRIAFNIFNVVCFPGYGIIKEYTHQMPVGQGDWLLSRHQLGFFVLLSFRKKPGWLDTWSQLEFREFLPKETGNCFQTGSRCVTVSSVSAPLCVSRIPFPNQCRDFLLKGYISVKRREFLIYIILVTQW